MLIISSQLMCTHGFTDVLAACHYQSDCGCTCLPVVVRLALANTAPMMSAMQRRWGSAYDAFAGPGDERGLLLVLPVQVLAACSSSCGGTDGSRTVGQLDSGSWDSKMGVIYTVGQVGDMGQMGYYNGSSGKLLHIFRQDNRGTHYRSRGPKRAHTLSWSRTLMRSCASTSSSLTFQRVVCRRRDCAKNGVSQGGIPHLVPHAILADYCHACKRARRNFPLLLHMEIQPNILNLFQFNKNIENFSNLLKF